MLNISISHCLVEADPETWYFRWCLIWNVLSSSSPSLYPIWVKSIACSSIQFQLSRAHKESSWSVKWLWCVQWRFCCRQLPTWHRSAGAKQELCIMVTLEALSQGWVHVLHVFWQLLSLISWQLSSHYS